MSMEALNWSFPLRITGAKKAVLIAIANRADQGGFAFPSVASIALHSGFTARAVQVAIAQLEAMTVLRAERSAGRLSSRYWLNLSFTNDMIPPMTPPPTPQHVHGSRVNGAANPAGYAGLTPQDVQGSAGSTPQDVQGSTPQEMQGSAPQPCRRFAATPQEIHPRLQDTSRKEEASETCARANPLGYKPGSDSDPYFVAFWEAYPRKDDKGHARTAWASAIRKARPADIVAGVAGYRFDPSPRFRPLARTWLNGERWLTGLEDDGFDPVLRAVGLTPRDFEAADERDRPALLRLLQ